MNRTLIGRVVWGEAMTTASLFSDGRWSVAIDGREVPALTRAISAAHPTAGAGPQDGPFGRKVLTELAAAMRGTLVLEDGPMPPPGTVC